MVIPICERAEATSGGDFEGFGDGVLGKFCVTWVVCVAAAFGWGFWVLVALVVLLGWQAVANKANAHKVK